MAVCVCVRVCVRVCDCATVSFRWGDGPRSYVTVAVVCVFVIMRLCVCACVVCARQAREGHVG